MVTKVSKSATTQRFVAVTGASSADAQQFLRDHNYRLEAAVDAYFSKDQGAGPRLSPQQEKEATAALHALFDEYKDDAEPDTITAEGALTMFNEINVDVASVAVLPLSYYLDSPSLGHFTRAGYVEGWLRLGLGASLTGSPSKEKVLELQQGVVPALMHTFATDGAVIPPRYPIRATPSKKGLYTTVYEYTFMFARSEGQKNIGLDVAITFWDLLLPHAPSYDAAGTRTEPPSFTPAQFTLWKRFLTEEANVRIVSKDTWSQFLEFTQEIDPSFASHDFDAAWPSVIDEFVEWARKQLAHNA